MAVTTSANAVISEEDTDYRSQEKIYIASVFCSRCFGVSMTPVFGSLSESVVQIAIEILDKWILERQWYNFEVEFKEAYFSRHRSRFSVPQCEGGIKEQARTKLESKRESREMFPLSCCMPASEYPNIHTRRYDWNAIPHSLLARLSKLYERVRLKKQAFVSDCLRFSLNSRRTFPLESDSKTESNAIGGEKREKREI